MASKFTPGPWLVRCSAKGYPYQIEAPNGNRGPGGITCVTRWAAISFPTSTEGQANARLIAAAPNLLEALEAAFEMHVSQHPKWEAIARAAIAKATGGSHD